MKKPAYYLALLAFMAFVVLLVTYEKLDTLDERAAKWLYEQPVLFVFDDYGTAIITAALVGMLVCLVVKKNYRLLVVAVIALVGDIAINQVLKNVIGRVRPETAADTTSYSFPSGHTMISFAALFFLAYVLTRYVTSRGAKIAIWNVSLGLAVMMGLSRVGAGDHFVTDVFAGWALTYAWVMLVVYSFERKSGVG